MLVSYVYEDYGCESHPVACVVATGPNNIGVSIAHPKDRFNKKMARHIAAERAKHNICPPIPSRYIINQNYRLTSIFEAVNEAVSKMEVRAAKYYKD